MFSFILFNHKLIIFVYYACFEMCSVLFICRTILSSLASLHLKGRMHELIGGHLLVEHQDLLRGPDPALLMRPPDMVDDFSLGKHGSR